MKTRQADLALLNGKVVTFDEKDNHAEAVTASANRIAFVGSNEEAKRFIDRSTVVEDLEGKVLLPGFIDAHTHFIQMGLAFDMVDLKEAKSLPETLDKIKERVSKTPKGGLITAVNWDESKWPEKRYITRRDLDTVTTDHLVAAARVDGHTISVNTQLLKFIKVPSDVRGVEVDARGEPTGILKEDAVEYARKMSPASLESMVNALDKATHYAHSLGVTSVNDTVSSSEISAYLHALRGDKLQIRVYLNFREELLQHLLSVGLSTGFGNDKLKIGAAKLFSDGSIGSRTAALSGEFADDKGNKGMLMYEKGRLEELVAEANRGGIQVAVHAIGDKAIGITLDAIESALRSIPREDHRHRIEHMELVTDQQIGKAVELGVIASMQPNFIGEWGLPGDMYEKRLGKRWLHQNNPYRKILDREGVIAFGSDCMPFSPLYGIHWAVNAPTESQRISVHEAIECYTKNSAYATFEEDLKGTIEVGKLADMVVLSDDPFENPARIREIRVIMTIHDGKIVYKESGSPQHPVRQ